MKSFSILPFVLLFLLSFGDSQLIAYPAWIKETTIDESVGVILHNGMRFCPDDLSKKGFNILCMSDGESRKADFYVDDERIIRDRKPPYFMIRNTKNGKLRPWREWRDFEGEVVIKCTQLRGRQRVTSETEVELILSCEEGDSSPDGGEEATEDKPEEEEMPSVMPSSSPSAISDPMMEGTEEGDMKGAWDVGESLPKLVLKAAGAKVDGEMGRVLMNDMKVCPAVEFNYGELSVECIGDENTKKAEFYVDGVLVRSESTAPYFVAGDTPEKVNAWTNYPTDMSFELRCDLTDKVTGAMTSRSVMISFSCDDVFAEGVTTTGSGCVVIDAKFTRLSRGWEEKDNGVAFRPESTSLGIAGPGSFPLVYKFTAPTTAKLGFVVDMTTGHRVEHNDIYAKFEEVGFQLMKGGVIYEDPKNPHGLNWIKVYHNSNGQDTISNSVDFQPHSIATREVLEEGVEYTVKLAGRSSMVEVHRIILFPCEGSGCQKASSMWKKNLNSCKNVGKADD